VAIQPEPWTPAQENTSRLKKKKQDDDFSKNHRRMLRQSLGTWEERANHSAKRQTASSGARCGIYASTTSFLIRRTPSHAKATPNILLPTVINARR
jgi:hypothetical protein